MTTPYLKYLRIVELREFIVIIPPTKNTTNQAAKEIQLSDALACVTPPRVVKPLNQVTVAERLVFAPAPLVLGILEIFFFTRNKLTYVWGIIV
jgi:hypothetical protein